MFHKRAILLIFQPEFIKNVLDIPFYPESAKGPTMVGLKNNFQTKVLIWLVNAFLTLAFANAVNTSYTFFQHL